MSRRPNRQAIRDFVEECFEGTDAPASVLDQAVAFLYAWASLPIRQQFALQQRDAFGKTHEDAARAYSIVFHEPITPAGIAASCAAARSQASLALRPATTTSAPSSGDASPGTSSSASRKSVNRQTPPRRPQAPA